MIIRFRKISKVSLLLLLSAGIGLGSLVILSLLGLLVQVTAGTISVNGDITIDIGGIINMLLFWPFFSVLWILLTWMFCALGLWLFAKWRPLSLRVDIVSDEEQ